MTNHLSLGKPHLSQTDIKFVVARRERVPPTMQSMGDQPFADMGDRLRAAMAEAKVNSAADLARKLNLHDARVRNWCNGTARPIVDEALRLKRLLGITLDWLYDDDPAGLSTSLNVRLEARLAGMQPPAETDQPVEASALEASGSVERSRRAASAPANAKIGS